MTESFHEWLRRNAKKKSRFFTRFAREAVIKYNKRAGDEQESH